MYRNKWSKINLHIIINPEKDCEWIAKKIIQVINYDETEAKQQKIKDFNTKDDMKEYVIKYSKVEEKILYQIEISNVLFNIVFDGIFDIIFYAI